MVSPDWGASRATVASLNLFVFHTNLEGQVASLETVEGDTLLFSFDGLWSNPQPCTP